MEPSFSLMEETDLSQKPSASTQALLWYSSAKTLQLWTLGTMTAELRKQKRSQNGP